MPRTTATQNKTLNKIARIKTHFFRAARSGGRLGMRLFVLWGCLFLVSCFGSKAKKNPLASISRMPSTGFGWNGQYSVWLTEASLDGAGTAAVAGLRRMGFALDHLGSRRGSQSAYLLAKAQGDKETRTAEVKINPGARGKTEIQVKVGVVGDRTASERLLEEIRQALGGKERPQDPPSATPSPTDPGQDSGKNRPASSEKGKEKGEGKDEGGAR